MTDTGISGVVYDRRERIIKLSRITHKPLKSILNEATTKRTEIINMFKQVSLDLEGSDFYRYHKSISPAIQEYIEAISFIEYLQNDTLISKEKVDIDFKDEEGSQFLLVTNDDYLLGIADLTGELMRHAINCIGVGDHDRAIKICKFLRDIKSGYDILKIPKRDPLNKKMEIMHQSLIKVEDACYALIIRGSEYPKEFYQHIVSEHAKNFDVEMDTDE
ncbi:9512_t:CDS:2 [Diversispora eburnea]|uniref:9512_t:CDS:1 n=1 Tax=Diversispora eburnea TaxID=1213867 RepID=A0A9N8VU31_9GLOM|nr:9512_t:CDS:2 [Diversispora eburnea]